MSDLVSARSNAYWVLGTDMMPSAALSGTSLEFKELRTSAPTSQVFLKTWIRVWPTKFFNPMLDLPEWRALKTNAQILKEEARYSVKCYE